MRRKRSSPATCWRSSPSSAEASGMSDVLRFAGHEFTSRLLIGTGKYKDFPTMQQAIVASGAQMVTVAVRRLDLQAQGEKSLLHWIPKECVLLPNTAGCFNADEAVRTLRLARELEIGGPKPLVKVPVIVDAGVGTASDCAVCMELGVSGLLVNTAISGAQDPVAMATAMKLATEAGRLAFLAGRIPRKLYGSASSPLTGLI